MKKIASILSFLSFTLFFQAPAFAQSTFKLCPDEARGKSNFQSLCGLTFDNFGGLLSNIILLILIIAVIIALIFLIWGGIKWILSGGDKAGVEAARNHVVAAIVGLIIAFLAFFIIQVVAGLFGIKVTELTLPKLTP